MKDYETKYYDLLYKYKKVKKENYNLKEEIELIKKLQKKDLIDIIVKEIIKYKNK